MTHAENVEFADTALCEVERRFVTIEIQVAGSKIAPTSLDRTTLDYAAQVVADMRKAIKAAPEPGIYDPQTAAFMALGGYAGPTAGDLSRVLPDGRPPGSCRCASDGNAKRCPIHTQQDYDDADRAIGREQAVEASEGDAVTDADVAAAALADVVAQGSIIGSLTARLDAVHALAAKWNSSGPINHVQAAAGRHLREALNGYVPTKDRP